MIYTTAEAAERLEISPSRVKQFCVSGRLSAIKKGKTWLIDGKELSRFKRIERKVGRPAESC